MDRDKKILVIVAGVAGALGIAFWGVVIYVAWHFIAKLW